MADEKPFIQKLEEDYLVVVGKCITEWAHIEAELFAVCHQILGTTKERTAIVYYRTPTIASRITLTDELLGTVFPKPKKTGEHFDSRLKHIQKVLRALEAELPIRNRVAHSPASPHMDDIEGDFYLRDVWYATHVSPEEQARGRATDVRPLKKTDVEAHIQRVVSLYMDLRGFQLETLRAALSTSSASP